jgi:hypothetical protein
MKMAIVATKLSEALSLLSSDEQRYDVDYQFIVTQERAASDEIEVIFEGTAVQDGTRWNPPSMTYLDFQHTFDTTGLTRTYCARNTFDRWSADWADGYYMDMDTFLNTFYPGAGFSFEDFCNPSITPNAKLTLVSGGYEITILGSQIQDGSRHSYTAEDGSGAVTYDCGFVFAPAAGSDPDTVRFAIGQLVPSEQTSQMFLTLADGGTTIKFTQDRSQPKWNTFNAYVSTDIGGSATAIIPGNTGTIATNGYLRFALDQDDYLSDARFYYEYTNTGAEPVDPSVLTSPIFNVQAAQYQPPGNAYPVALQLTGASETLYRFKVFAYGQGATDSDIYSFTVEIE